LIKKDFENAEKHKHEMEELQRHDKKIRIACDKKRNSAE
jgi:hypothetical protein